MQQRLARISVPQRHSADTQRPHQETEVQQRLLSAESFYFVQVQFMKVHKYDACSHKKHQLD